MNINTFCRCGNEPTCIASYVDEYGSEIDAVCNWCRNVLVRDPDVLVNENFAPLSAEHNARLAELRASR